MKAKQKHRLKVDAVRKNAGLPVFDKPLIPAKCEKCDRVYYFRVVPKLCVWPNCGGEYSNQSEAKDGV